MSVPIPYLKRLIESIKKTKEELESGKALSLDEELLYRHLSFIRTQIAISFNVLGNHEKDGQVKKLVEKHIKEVIEEIIAETEELSLIKREITEQIFDEYIKSEIDSYHIWKDESLGHIDSVDEDRELTWETYAQMEIYRFLNAEESQPYDIGDTQLKAMFYSLLLRAILILLTDRGRYLPFGTQERIYSNNDIPIYIDALILPKTNEPSEDTNSVMLVKTSNIGLCPAQMMNHLYVIAEELESMEEKISILFFIPYHRDFEINKTIGIIKNKHKNIDLVVFTLDDLYATLEFYEGKAERDKENMEKIMRKRSW